ncbi:MAG: glycosyltransferase family 2 protein [Candidatus Bathyarchaeota archaeon]|nr:glycosyltransferase family 2 protein [Candidatus Bathyarchaeota archaeon]
MILEVAETVFALATASMVVYLIRHFVFTFTVLRRAKNTTKAASAEHVAFEPTVAILIPARDEENVIGRLLQRMVELTYPKDKLQVTVVNDGSSDNTGRIADEYAKQYAFIKVLHRDRRDGGKGKAAAMNAGLRQSIGEIVLCFDADYCPQREIVEKLVEGFADPTVGAVQGRVVVLNEPQNTVTRLVALERIGGYRVDQEARDTLSLTPQFGGTVGGFRRSLLERLGGWDESTLAEDTDLTFRTRLAGYKIRYVGGAECYEEAVDNWKAYRKQRYRWALGHMQCCLRHSWKVIKSKRLKMKEKVDGLLLLHVYFMPIVALVSFLIGVPLVVFKLSEFVGALWFSVPVSLYSFVGNFAPFF